MIELILTGGLGNQMFEFAAAKALSLRLGKELKIDLYALNKHTKGTKRSFELDIFDIDAEITSSLKNKLLVKAFPYIEKNKPFFLKHLGYFRDDSAIVYASDFSKLRGNTILHGHFQNTKYFEGYEDIIRKCFQFRNPLDKKNAALLKEIKETESVSIHIRRGDYLTNQQAKSNFAVCSLDYYQQTIKWITEKVQEPHFYIFSDDIKWAKKHLLLEQNATFIDWNLGEESYKDMQLMSMCRHNIIANSSFSWWAAWLNHHENKNVFAPAQWFTQEIRNKDLTQFYPKNWIII